MADRISFRTMAFGLVGFLFLVELTSGILQGYYVPLASRIAGHIGVDTADYNWTEAAQLLVSALVVPVLAKLGDMFGHKRILLASTAVTALASWGMVASGSFAGYLIAFAFQGFYVVWLPLEVALIFDRGRRTGNSASTTRRAAGLLVVALEAGAILGALAGSRVFTGTGENFPVTLAVPAICVTLVFFAILFGVRESTPLPGRKLDGGGFMLLTLALLFITGGLTFLRLNGPSSWTVWVPIVIGLLIFVPFARLERRHPDPAIDLRVLTKPSMWPVQLTAGLFGISVLGAQIPLSTFAAADPTKLGYGLNLDSDVISYLIGAYLIALIVGALLFPLLARRTTPRIALIVAAFLVAAGYLLFIPLHDQVWQVIVNMVIAGIGSGALVAALPSAAAAAAPAGQSGIATGLTNTTKTIGGAFASAVFGVILHVGLTSTASTSGAGLAAYIAVWTICGVGALVAAVLLFLVPKLAFSDSEVDLAADAVGAVETPAP
ncbi:MAG TPA: MFS transporter [Pseudolysinimonas sp.]|nr:MFS transporter [Pseudolysinimonas sp.]